MGDVKACIAVPKGVDGLLYVKTDHGLSLIGYSDSDWASCSEDRRSTTGYYFSLNLAPCVVEKLQTTDCRIILV